MTAATSAAVPGVRGDELDDLVLDEGGVDVHDDEPGTAPRQPGRGDRDVTPGLGRDEGEVAAQRRHVGAGDVELDRRHGPARQPADAVDVRAVPGDRPGDGRDVPGLEGRRHDDDGGPPGAAAGVVAATADERDVHAHRLTGPREAVGEDVLVATGREQHRQGEVAPHDDLLDVEDVRAHRGGGLEDGLGDARPVGTAQRHQERA